MKHLLTSLLLLALFGVSASQRPGVPAAPDLLLLNGSIATLDGKGTIVQALAIAGDRISASGTVAELRALAGPSTRVIDLGGRSVIPGLMDNHLHGAGGGPGVDLSRARSMADVLANVAARVRASKSGDLIVSNSDWHEAQLKELRLPLRDDLDRVAPDNPVVLVRGGHEYILNSKALARWSIGVDTAVPEGGRASRYPNGRLNGELVDTARSLASLPPPAPKSREQAMADRAAEYRTLHAAGLTSVRHPGISVDEYRLLQEMQRREMLTMRVNALLRPGGNVSAMLTAVDGSGLTPATGDSGLRVGGVKLAVDGGFEGGWMREPYDEPYGEHGTFRGLNTMTAGEFTEAVRGLNRRGWRVGTHAVGDAAIDLVLDGYDAANRESSIAGRRWSIEHAFIGRPDQLARMKSLQLSLSVQDHLYLAGPSLVKYWGRARASLTTPVRLYLDAGLPVSSGTDAPVVPYPPLWTLYHFVTRDTIAGGVLGPDQRISRMEALRMATTANALLTFEENEKGSLEPGKLADLVVLSVDPLTCSDVALRDARVLLTMVGGKVVFDAGTVANARGRAGL